MYKMATNHGSRYFVLYKPAPKAKKNSSNTGLIVCVIYPRYIGRYMCAPKCGT